jgi:hypothetical protein
VARLSLCGFLKLFEAECQSVSIGIIPKPSRPVDQRSGDSLQPEFEERAIVDFEQPIRDVDAVIGVDPDQVGVEGRMMDLR